MNKKVLVGMLSSAGLAAIMYLRTTYQVNKVIDGDTFVTKENQNIRIAGIEAPELNYCGGIEAKQALEKLVLGKRLKLKVVFNDNYKRLVSYVYDGNKSINTEMLKQGWAYMASAPDSNTEDFVAATDYARNNKLGIFSDKCTQKKNLNSLKCVIKGNVGRDGKTYYYPGCINYTVTDVQLYMGDRWFCTEKEAEMQGFTKAEHCP